MALSSANWKLLSARCRLRLPTASRPAHLDRARLQRGERYGYRGACRSDRLLGYREWMSRGCCRSLQTVRKARESAPSHIASHVVASRRTVDYHSRSARAAWERVQGETVARLRDSPGNMCSVSTQSASPMYRLRTDRATHFATPPLPLAVVHFKVLAAQELRQQSGSSLHSSSL